MSRYKNVLIQDGTKIVQKEVWVEATYDPETGEIIIPAHWEIQEVEVPNMIPQTVPFTPEEEEEADRQEAEEEARRRQEPPTEMETLEAQMAYTAMMTDTLLEG